MAHIYFMTRGVKHSRDLFVEHMACQYFPWKRKDKDGKDILHRVQGQLRPIELWEYIVPEDHVNEALTMMNIEEPYFGNKKLKALVPIARKFLGAKKLKYTTEKEDRIAMKKILEDAKVDPKEIPKIIDANIKDYKRRGYRFVNTNKFIFREGLGVEVIGVKKDKKGIWHKEGYTGEQDFTQEML